MKQLMILMMEKFGQGFSAVDPLEKIDIGDGSIPSPKFTNAITWKPIRESKGKLNRLFLYLAKAFSRIYLGGRTAGGF